MHGWGLAFVPGAVMKKAAHWLAHKFGMNLGQVETWWQDQRLMVGFRCDGCGLLEHVHESYVTLRRLRCPVMRAGESPA